MLFETVTDNMTRNTVIAWPALVPKRPRNARVWNMDTKLCLEARAELFGEAEGFREKFVVKASFVVGMASVSLYFKHKFIPRKSRSKHCLHRHA